MFNTITTTAAHCYDASEGHRFSHTHFMSLYLLFVVGVSCFVEVNAVRLVDRISDACQNAILYLAEVRMLYGM